MFWFRMNNIRDNRQASKDERFSETRREINKDIVAPKKPWQTPIAQKDCPTDSLNCFSPLQMLIPRPPPCLCWVSGIHRECNHGSTRSTRPITVHERTAICKSQLEPIIENPGNTRGAEQAFGRWYADGLHRGLVCLQRRLPKGWNKSTWNKTDSRNY